MDLPQISEIQAYGALGISIAVATLVVTIQKVFKNFRKEREEYAAKILQIAKEDDNSLKARLEARIAEIDTKVKTLEISVNKDITHLKETYSAEIKVLGEKIETLRDELRNQHSQMVTLLSKLIDSKD
jgi:CII-binding regulator of phage lambda lysogenization HflD